MNTYPQEIEDTLTLHPAVADLTVIGMLDDEMSEQVVAVVQPAEWPSRATPSPPERTTLPLLTLACAVINVRRLIKTEF